eukprot:gnl/TRDRNA2_/TRDRNA2_53236_c0_seq1.p1 gnl/TRDRNA2_/TRDRNA2_53236_c0~~gnl/TRDRNA2_/TRDRNA2_53236_c0_seq1.p1  ORF type:complete len:367 (-),score=42.74 gnl/TRDRNA2_/TRDRNA2_53236_c0_seq1:223-1323(-)
MGQLADGGRPPVRQVPEQATAPCGEDKPPTEAGCGGALALRSATVSAIAAITAVIAAVGLSLMRSPDGVFSSLLGGAPPGLAQARLSRVLVLRLARAKDRTEGLVEQARQMGLPLEFVAAADGLDAAFSSRVLPFWMPEATCADFVGAIFASHERAWAVAADSEGPTLVLEDDARLPHTFLATIAERMWELPSSFDLALAGSSVTPEARAHGTSGLLLRPNAEDPNGQAVLGAWAYVVSPRGAKRLKRLARAARGCGKEDSQRRGHRLFQPVDLFIAHRLSKLSVFGFEPTPELAAEFAMDRDQHHVLSTMRQIGVVRIARLPSLNHNGTENHAEAASVRDAISRVVRLGEAQKSAEVGNQYAQTA